MSNTPSIIRENDFCDECPHRRTCTLQFDESGRESCPVLNGNDEPLYYRNSEGYSDPTAFLALRSAMRSDMRKERSKVHRQTCCGKKHHKVQVVRYD